MPLSTEPKLDLYCMTRVCSYSARLASLPLISSLTHGNVSGVVMSEGASRGRLGRVRVTEKNEDFGTLSGMINNLRNERIVLLRVQDSVTSSQDDQTSLSHHCLHIATINCCDLSRRDVRGHRLEFTVSYCGFLH